MCIHICSLKHKQMLFMLITKSIRSREELGYYRYNMAHRGSVPDVSSLNRSILLHKEPMPSGV